MSVLTPDEALGVDVEEAIWLTVLVELVVVAVVLFATVDVFVDVETAKFELFVFNSGVEAI